MMINATPEHIYIEPTDPSMVRVLQNHFKAPKLKAGYRLPLTLWIMRELVTVLPELKTHTEVLSAGKMLRKEWDRLNEIRKKPLPTITNGKFTFLRDYQVQDANYICELDSAAIFNEPRTGKTPTIIEVLRRKELTNTLIVCPASLLYNWKYEFEKFWKDVPVKIVNGTAKQRAVDYTIEGIKIVSKNTLSADKDILKTMMFDAVVVDEAHFLRNYNTGQSKAVFSLKAKHRYALTGTPVVNGGSDMYGIVHFLYPKMFTSYWQFVDLFFEVTETSYDGVNNVREVGNIYPHRLDAFNQMIALWSTQRQRKDIMKWLPPKQRTVIAVEMDAKQRKLYKDMLKTFEATDENGSIADAQNIITQLTRVRQICQDPALLGLKAPSAKTAALLEYVENHPTEPLVIMSWFTSHLKLLEPVLTKLGRKVGMIHGEMSSTQKSKSAAYFQSGNLDLLLCNTVSAGTGFTLDTGNTVVFLDKPWTLAELEQAEDRVCPTMPGKDLKHNIITFVCKNSIDQKIERILAQKMDASKMIKNGGAEIIRRLFDDEDFSKW